MLDWYQPKPTLNCPFCGKTLTNWQGKDAACLLFIWQQGVAHPIDQKGDGEDFQIAEADFKNWKLPIHFGLYSTDCDCPYPTEAIGKTKDDVWISTEFVTAENAVQRKDERQEQFKARIKWLRSAGSNI